MPEDRPLRRQRIRMGPPVTTPFDAAVEKMVAERDARRAATGLPRERWTTPDNDNPNWSGQEDGPGRVFQRMRERELGIEEL